MQIIETGFYKARDGGLIYIVGFLPESLCAEPVVGFFVESEEVATWTRCGWGGINTMQCFIKLTPFIIREI